MAALDTAIFFGDAEMPASSAGKMRRVANSVMPANSENVSGKGPKTDVV